LVFGIPLKKKGFLMALNNPSGGISVLVEISKDSQYRSLIYLSKDPNEKSNNRNKRTSEQTNEPMNDLQSKIRH